MVIRFCKKDSDTVTTIGAVHICQPLWDGSELEGYKLVLEKKTGGLDTLYLKNGRDFDQEQFEVAKDEEVPCIIALTRGIKDLGLNPEDYDNAEDFIDAVKSRMQSKEIFEGFEAFNDPNVIN